MNSGSNSNQVTAYDWSDSPIVAYSLHNGTHMEFCCYDWSVPIIPVYWMNSGSNSNQVTGYDWSDAPIVT